MDDTIKRGRKRFTPLEALYYKHVEVMLLLGIHMGKSEHGCSLTESINSLGERLGKRYSRREVEALMKAFNTANHQFRDFARENRCLQEGEK